MLDKQSWLPFAKELVEGERRRVNHDCGEGRTLLVSRTEKGWDAWCYRCSDKGFEPAPRPSLAERIAKLREERQQDEKAVADPRPPQPMNFDVSTWPMAARVWLYKAGLSNDRINELGFYWHEKMSRVVMPVLHDRKVCYWQARGFNPKLAKYINPPIYKPLYKIGTGSPLVLTEDMLSAARVGEVTEAWSIMGTSVDEAKLTDIVAQGKPVLVWLDPDKAGVTGRRKLVPKLRAYGVDARSIKAEQDPKLYSKQEIEQWIMTSA